MKTIGVEIRSFTRKESRKHGNGATMCPLQTAEATKIDVLKKSVVRFQGGRWRKRSREQDKQPSYFDNYLHF